MLRKAASQNDLFPRMQPAELEVATNVEARFRRSGYPYLSGLKCQVREGVAVLSGAVPTFYLKQLAQELAAHTLGVRQVNNHVQVASRDLPAKRPAG